MQSPHPLLRSARPSRSFAPTCPDSLPGGMMSGSLPDLPEAARRLDAKAIDAQCFCCFSPQDREITPLPERLRSTSGCSDAHAGAYKPASGMPHARLCCRERRRTDMTRIEVGAGQGRQRQVLSPRAVAAVLAVVVAVGECAWLGSIGYGAWCLLSR